MTSHFIREDAKDDRQALFFDFRCAEKLDFLLSELIKFQTRTQTWTIDSIHAVRSAASIYFFQTFGFYYTVMSLPPSHFLTHKVVINGGSVYDVSK